MVVVNRIRWWPLHSTTHLWTRRWFRSPAQRHRVLNSRGTGSQLWSLPRLLCCVSLWQQWISGIEPLRGWQQLCEPTLAILVCPWHIPPGLWDWCCTTGDWLWPCSYTAVLIYLGFFCRPWDPRTSGVSASDNLPFESRVQPIEAGLNDGCLYAGGLSLIKDLQIGPATWFQGWSGDLACGRAPVSWYACDTVSTSHNHWGGREEPRHCKPSVSGNWFVCLMAYQPL